MMRVDSDRDEAESSIQGLNGASKNIANAISFLQVQDGILASAGEIVSRMGELQGMSADVLKNSGDIDNYEAEFNDLRNQLYNITKSQFNGVNLFGDWYNNDTTSAAASDGISLIMTTLVPMSQV